MGNTLERAELMHAGESWSPERCKGVAECSGRLEMLGWAVEASDSTNGTKVSGAGNLSCQSYLDEGRQRTKKRNKRSAARKVSG